MTATEYPKFERRENEGVTLLTKQLDEFGEWQTIRSHLSEKTAARLKQEIDSAIKLKST